MIDFIREDAAFSAAFRGMYGCCSFCQCSFGFFGEGAEGHVGYVDGMIKNHWPACIFPNDGCCINISFISKWRVSELSS